MDYSAILEYSNFLLREHEENLKLKMFLNESVLQESSDDIFRDMKILNEGFIDSIKGLLSKLGDAIVNMWKKFINRLDIIFKNDAKYLAKYKDIILKKRLKEASYVMYDYPEAIRKMEAILPPNIRINDDSFINQFDNDVSNDPKELASIAKKMYSNIDFEDDDNSVLKDSFKEFFRGENEIEIQAEKINMTDMYTYCTNFDSMKKRLDRDLTKLKNDYTTCINSIEKQSSNIKEESYDMFYNNRSYYSFIEESTIYENNIAPHNKKKKNSQASNTSTNSTQNSNQNDSNKTSTQASNTSTNSTQTSSQNNSSKTSTQASNTSTNSTQTSSQNNSETNDNKTNSNQDNSVKDVKAAENQNKEKYEKMSNALKTYYKIAGQLLAAKLDILENAYTTYMKFIRTHVSNYVGNKGKEEFGEDKVADKKSKTPDNYNPFGDKNLNSKDTKEEKNEEKEEESK